MKKFIFISLILIYSCGVDFGGEIYNFGQKPPVRNILSFSTSNIYLEYLSSDIITTGTGTVTDPLVIDLYPFSNHRTLFISKGITTETLECRGLNSNAAIYDYDLDKKVIELKSSWFAGNLATNSYEFSCRLIDNSDYSEYLYFKVNLIHPDLFRVNISDLYNGFATDISSPMLSGNGKKIVFTSAQKNLINDKTTTTRDIFVKDLETNIITRISLKSDGVEASENSSQSFISETGRFVVFTSAASLVPEDTYVGEDVYLYDLQTSTISLISVSSDGIIANNASSAPSISSDGMYVAFLSNASNLVPGDTNGIVDLFLHNRLTGQTTRVSKKPDGSQITDSPPASPRISGNARYIVFNSVSSQFTAGDNNAKSDVFRVDIQDSTISLVSISVSAGYADNSSLNPSISSDGNIIAFESTATNLVEGDSNGAKDCFVRDIEAETTIRASVSSAEAESNSISSNCMISSDGSRVAFVSSATTLTLNDTNASDDIFLRDLTLETTSLLSKSSGSVFSNNISSSPSISSEGDKIIFLSLATNLDTEYSNSAHLYLHDISSGTTTRESIGLKGEEADAQSSSVSLSGDGRFVAYESRASNLYWSDDGIGNNDIFLFDRHTGSLSGISKDPDGNLGTNDSTSPKISSDGNFVAFNSDGPLIASDTNDLPDVYLYNRLTGENSLISRLPGTLGNGVSTVGSISNNGKLIVFSSTSTNLSAYDSNSDSDIYKSALLANGTRAVGIVSIRYTTPLTGANGPSYNPTISGDSECIAYVSEATDLVNEENDTNNAPDVFLFDVGIYPPTKRISIATDGTHADFGVSFSTIPDISYDCRYIVFDSESTNLVDSDTNGVMDIFLRDNVNNTTTRISVSSDGTQADNDSINPKISSDGRYIVFQSLATNLVADDTNNNWDVFVHDTVTHETKLVSKNVNDIIGIAASSNPVISDDGSYIGFISAASNLVENDTNATTDVFVRVND